MIYIDFLWKPSAQKKEEKTATPVNPPPPPKKTPKKPQQLCSLTLDGIYNYECFAIMK